MIIREPAPAKINLALHVTGQRPDGFHLLDSLVCFANIADEIAVEAANTLSLTTKAPKGVDLPAVEDNLVMRAARLLKSSRGAKITLEKNLPVAAGIGGGSSDAAACLRALAKLWDVDLPDVATTVTLGADVPICLEGSPARMQGIGEELTPVFNFPKFFAVLVNPGVHLSTPAVFGQLSSKANAGLAPFPTSGDQQDWLDYLNTQRNDLEPAAIALSPAIQDVLSCLKSEKQCQFSRMSGSGATCFGVFENLDTARQAANSINRKHPDWWVKSCQFN